MIVHSGHLNKVIAFGGIYLDLFRLAAREVSLRYIVTVALLDLVGVLAYGSVIGLIAQFVSVAEHGKGDIVASFWSGSTLLALVVLGVCVLCLLVVAAFTSYMAAQKMRSIARRVHIRLVAKSIVSLGQLQYISNDELFPYPNRIQQYIIRDPMQGGMAIEVMLGLFQPMAHIIGAVIIILYLEPIISMGLLIGWLIFLPVIYMVSRAILQNAQQFYQSRVREMAQLVNAIVKRFDGTTLCKPTERDAQQLIEAEGYQGYLDGFDVNRLASQRMAFVINAFRAVAISIGVLIFGWLALEGDRSWSSLIGFVGGLLFFMNGAQGFMTRVATLNRLYPQVRGLNLFHSEIEKAGSLLPVQSDIPQRISLHVDAALENSCSIVDLNVGESAIVICSQMLRLHHSQGFLRPFIRASKGLEGLWCHADFVCAPSAFGGGVNIVDMVFGHVVEKKQLNELERFLRGVGTWDEMEEVSGGLDYPVQTNQLSRDAIVSISIAPAVMSQASSIIFLSFALFEGVSKQFYEKLLNYPIASYCFIVAAPCANLEAVPDYLKVVVADSECLVGAGEMEWWDQVKSSYADAAALPDREISGIDDEIFM